MSILLPTYYCEWLDQIEESECVKYSERFWFISSLSELEEEIEIDKMVTPNWKQLASLATMYQGLNQVDFTVDQDGNQISLERLSKCIVIGDDNGDPLFIDPSDGHSVWCYYLDGGDLQSISSSLKKFIIEAEVIYG